MNNPEHRDLRREAVRRYRRGTYLAFALLLVSLCATLLSWQSNRRQSLDRARARFNEEIDRTKITILSRLELYEDALYGTRSLFEANPDVDRKVFHDYVEHLDLRNRYPGIQGIGYAQYIDASELQAHIKAVRKEGFPSYTVRPEEPRTEYTSIVFLEPFDWRNQRAFGYDMYSEPKRRRAMEYARDTGKTSLTPKVRLVQETDTDVQPGFLMYLAVYKKGAATTTVEQRRAAIRGYIYSPFRVPTLMTELMQKAPALAEFAFFWGGASNDSSVMYETPGFGAISSPTISQLSSFEFGGQTWSLRFVSSPRFDAVVRENTNRAILPTGIAISLLLFGITISFAQTERRAIQLADEITARLRESERNILDMNAQLTEALYRSERLAITGRLLATVAHEINNPLTALHNLLFILKNSKPSDVRWQEFVRHAEDQVAVLTNISQQTLAQYRFAEFPVATNISELLDDVLAAFRPKLMAAKIRVDRRYPPSLQVTIYPSELRQVFTNLIANAIDAMLSGGSLSIAVTESPGSVSVAIADQGPGIPEERLRRIFEPFSPAKSHKGSGVGLWVVKSIVEKVGGTIEVHSSRAVQDHGTIVTVTVPNRKATIPRETEQSEPAAPESASESRSRSD